MPYNWLMSPDICINQFKKKLSSCNVRRAKIIAIALSRNENIISFATNQVLRGVKGKFTLHAEENLVRKLRNIKAIERFGKIDILVLRWCKTKKWTSARPCSRCMDIINRYGIKNIFFTDEVGCIQQV
jgi:hypothetical protein